MSFLPQERSQKKEIVLVLRLGWKRKVEQKDESKIQFIFATRKVTKKKYCSGFKTWFEKRAKTQCLVSYESYLVDISPNCWWIDIGASIHIMNSL